MAQLTINTELDDCFVKTAANIRQYFDDEEQQKKMLKQLRETLIENCIEYTRIKCADEIKEKLELSRAEPERKVEDMIKKYKKAISKINIDPLGDSRLLEYDRQIETLIQADKATPNGNLDDTDADLRVTACGINVIDPITKTRMTDPVRNAVCGHIYDKNSLIAMLEKNKKTRCPVIGCTSMAYIDLNQCRTDLATKIYLDNNPA